MIGFLRGFIYFCEHCGAPLVNLAIRIYMGLIFIRSGLQKIQNWDSALFLFESEHPVPYFTPEVLLCVVSGTQLAQFAPVETTQYINPSLAAYIAVSAELILSSLLFIGFGARFAAFGLLFMTGIIECTYQHFDVHAFWAISFAVIICYGADKLSIDYFLRREFLEIRRKTPGPKRKK